MDEELVPCPICGQVYIPESADLVCVDCEKVLKVDLAVHDLVMAACAIVTLDVDKLYERRESINETISRLTVLRGKLDEMHKKEVGK